MHSKALQTLGILIACLVIISCGSSSSSTDSPEQEPENKIIETEQQAFQFLTRATYGPTESEIDNLLRVDAEEWLNQQINTPVTSMRERLAVKFAQLSLVPESFETANYRRILFTDAFWETAVRANDQLRQRIAFALSQIMVVSFYEGSISNRILGVANYHDMLADHAFGNFRDLMEAVTLSPIMGDYLSMRRNEKPNLELNIRPDENYARELLQLFTVGLHELNIDGTYKLDSNGNLIPTYDQALIENFARVFTGWNYSGVNFFQSNFRSVSNAIEPMQAFEEFHDTDEKILFFDEILPAGQTAQQDLNQALDNIFNHPNIAPFISKQLIQKLVTSNPSPDYVRRVATIFNNNGFGERGDLEAVVKAILLDSEALNQTGTHFGKLNEPVLKFAQLFRAFNASGANGDIRFADPFSGGQLAYFSPSVFNFYRPDYAEPGEISDTEILSPEFGILNESTIIETGKRFSELVYQVESNANDQAPRLTIYFDYTNEIAIADDPISLIEHLDFKLLGSTFKDDSKQALADYINQIPSSQPELRVYEATNLILLSAQFAVQE